MPQSIDTVRSISVSDFRTRYLNQLKPLVIKGGVQHWPAVGKWNLDYLRSAIKPKTIELDNNQSKRNQYSFPEHIDDVQRAERDGSVPHYLTNANLRKYFPELLEDVEPYCPFALPDYGSSPLLPKDFMYDNYLVELLLGTKGNGFGVLHTDETYIHAFIAQLYGEKDFIAFAPEERDNLYPESEGALVSAIENVWEPDYERFPKLRDAKALTVTLQPGDLLFMPSGWWHTTRMHATSIGVTFNSVSEVNWAPFVQDASRRLQRRSGLKAHVMHLYMRTFGWLIKLAARHSHAPATPTRSAPSSPNLSMPQQAGS